MLLHGVLNNNHGFQDPTEAYTIIAAPPGVFLRYTFSDGLKLVFPVMAIAYGELPKRNGGCGVASAVPLHLSYDCHNDGSVSELVDDSRVEKGTIVEYGRLEVDGNFSPFNYRYSDGKK